MTLLSEHQGLRQHPDDTSPESLCLSASGTNLYSRTGLTSSVTCHPVLTPDSLTHQDHTTL